MNSWNYETIKELAQERGESVQNLCALAVNNDPFYVGMPAQVAAARWFMALWPRFGSVRRYLRGMHYQLVTQAEAVKLPSVVGWKDKETGERIETDVYLNNERCWEFLLLASKSARYLGLLGADELRDQRNREARVFRYADEDDVTEPEIGVEGSQELDLWEYTMPSLPWLGALRSTLPSLPRLGVDVDYSVAQPYHVEVWIEKATMDDELLPLCRRYSVNLVAGTGELSIPAVRALLERACTTRKPLRILYISDFDPAGLGMPVSVARKIEFYLRNQTNLGHIDAALEPIVLTAEQVRAYHLPRIPVKDGDRRKGNFEAVYGEGQVELDALTALHPGVFERIVEDAILRYYDPTLNNRVQVAGEELHGTLSDQTVFVREENPTAGAEWDAVQAEYAALRHDFEDTRRAFGELVRPFQAQIDAYKERLEGIKERIKGAYGMLYEDMSTAAADFPTWEYPAPQPDVVGDGANMLYRSDRDYLAQLAFYKTRKNGNGAGPAG